MSPTRKNIAERKTIGAFISRVGRTAWGQEFIAGISDAAEAHDLNLIIFVGGKPTPIITPGHIQASYGLRRGNMNTSSQALYRTPAPPVNPLLPFFHLQNL